MTGTSCSAVLHRSQLNPEGARYLIIIYLPKASTTISILLSKQTVQNHWVRGLLKIVFSMDNGSESETAFEVNPWGARKTRSLLRDSQKGLEFRFILTTIHHMTLCGLGSLWLLSSGHRKHRPKAATKHSKPGVHLKSPLTLQDASA